MVDGMGCVKSRVLADAPEETKAPVDQALCDLHVAAVELEATVETHIRKLVSVVVIPEPCPECDSTKTVEERATCDVESQISNAINRLRRLSHLLEEQTQQLQI